MIYPSDYPENGYLIEWNEQQQTLFRNEVRNGKTNMQTNVHDVIPVAVCNSSDEAFLIMKFVEDLLQTRGTLAYGKKATSREVELFIKKLIAFSDKHSRIVKKSK